jgi:hypothetical protein
MAVPKQFAKRMKLERKRLRKRETRLAWRRSLATRPYSTDSSPPPEVVYGPVGGLKMSDVLSDFVAPLANSNLDRSDLMQLLSMAQVAWNIALEPKYRHETMIDDAIEERLIRPKTVQRMQCRELLCWLVARKLECFAKCHRPILAFQVEDLEDGGYYLSVISGLVR